MQKAKVRSGIELVIVENEAEFAKAAADKVSELLKQKPNAVLGLPTGSTPETMYAELVRRYKAGLLDFGQVTTFNLDEYVGLSDTHPQSYHSFMKKHLFDGVNIPSEARHLPSGETEPPEESAAAYEALLNKLGPIDLMILGIGTNGHIGFNEPGTPFDSRVHITSLAPSTIQANSRFFSDENEVPREAVTTGIGNILEARQIMLLAKGESKAEAIAATLQGEVTIEVPASALQQHNNVYVVVDKAAASLLKLE